uniref:Portal protein n=1 Tax=Gokushovirinae environmental samples TaxID=1478972 RepID=A0A2R3UAG1_9VIRU|nr:portal protein [Gokushovirinae environmental samples]
MEVAMSHQYFLEHGECGEVYSARNPLTIQVDADVSGVSMTRQEFTEECDINAIMARYEKHGVWPMKPNDYVPMYVDFTTMPDNLQSAMLQMMDAEEAFMRLPAVVRKEFDNDPLRFVEYASDGNNIEQLRAWGLAEPEKAPDAPMRVEVVNQPSNENKPPEAVAKVKD